MPGAFVYGLGPGDDLGDVLADLLLRGDRVDVEGGVLLSPRRTNADRQRAYRARKALRTRNANALRERNAEAENFEQFSGSSNGNPPRGGSTVTDTASVTPVTRNADERNARVTPQYDDDGTARTNDPWTLPPMTDEQRDGNRAAVADLRERMKRGDL